ncbi:hypothetical protein BC826DRAFT_1076495 [Russula brevipes]|nr:hypothetical protein BC826DRAFT_1076495 [Russula brevipes]
MLVLYSKMDRRERSRGWDSGHVEVFSRSLTQGSSYSDIQNTWTPGVHRNTSKHRTREGRTGKLWL